MIARMVKVEIIGPNERLMEVLDLLRDLGVFQIEQDITCFVTAGEEEKVRSLNLDEKTVAERIFFEDLKAKIDELTDCLPQVEVRESYLDPGSVLDSVAATVQRHGTACREWRRKREALRKELAELSSYTVFLGALEPLVGRMNPRSGLDFIGVTIKDPAALEELMRLLARLTEGKFEVLTVKAEDGTLIGLITLDKELADKVRHVMGDQHVPELTFPAALADLTFPEKIRYLRERIAGINNEIAAIDRDLTQFALRWGAIYHGVRRWLAERLSLLTNMAYLHQTGMCFFIHGWTPEAEVARMDAELERKFGGEVIVERKQILEQDLDLVPVTLRNPPY
ncbi:MAG TPA: ATPase, partial [Geobacteraceae bacterium]|nr:ATPase [Geobacteraceae bacterium]